MTRSPFSELLEPPLDIGDRDYFEPPGGGGGGGGGGGWPAGS
jgi:hypothetical protein